MNTELQAAAPPPGFQSTAIAGIRETAVTAAAAQATAAVQSRYVMAMQRPRNFDEVRISLVKECRRPGFAESARYSLPRTAWDSATRTRKEVSIEGFSIRFAEAALRCFKNVLVETTVVYEDDEKRIVRVSLTDLEANVTYPKDVTIKKTIERKFTKPGQVVRSEREGSDGKAVFTVEATDDELLMKENALVSRAIRTNGLRLIPGDILDDCEVEIEMTLSNKDKKDPDATRKKLLDSFASIEVSPAQIAEFLGHSTAEISLDEIKRMRGVFTLIKDGRTWDSIMADVLESRAAFGGGPAESGPETTALIKRLAELRATTDATAYALAMKNFGIDEPAKASRGQLEQAVAALSKVPTPEAAKAPAETPSEFAARMAAKAAAKDGAK